MDFELSAAKDYVKSCTSTRDALFAFAIIILIIQTCMFVIVLLHYIAKSKTLCFPWSKWFIIFQLCMFVGTTVFWMIHFFFEGQCGYKNSIDWSIITLFICSIIGIVVCVLMIIPCKNSVFIYLYLIGTLIHFIFTWIYYLRTCGGYWYYSKNQNTRFINYTLTEFIFITVVFVFEILLNFQIDFKLNPQ
ncbi:uncharacterized protein MONOS_18027 [Monocercomonoides exilis]|uniref:uncharacterized protein n=1 Tax=Monocercomonoides exilis TaxID=2049356 RepID=UPI003559FF85|nr:hypothetical protein MONOS_18027 [Monocercomonoides exilis]